MRGYTRATRKQTYKKIDIKIKPSFVLVPIVDFLFREFDL